MPLYEYACQECKCESELLVNNGSQPACPKCGSPKMDKLFSIIATHTRGGSPGERPQSSGDSCGSHCGCHPHG